MNEDKKGIIHRIFIMFDNIKTWLLSNTVRKFQWWFFHTSFYDWFWREILWGVFGAKIYHRPNDFQEANFSIYIQKERAEEKIRLFSFKEEMGEEALIKMLKKKHKRKDFNRIMGRIKRWKEKGEWSSV